MAVKLGKSVMSNKEPPSLHLYDTYYHAYDRFSYFYFYRERNSNSPVKIVGRRLLNQVLKVDITGTRLINILYPLK